MRCHNALCWQHAARNNNNAFIQKFMMISTVAIFLVCFALQTFLGRHAFANVILKIKQKLFPLHIAVDDKMHCMHEQPHCCRFSFNMRVFGRCMVYSMLFPSVSIQFIAFTFQELVSIPLFLCMFLRCMPSHYSKLTYRAIKSFDPILKSHLVLQMCSNEWGKISVTALIHVIHLVQLHSHDSNDGNGELLLPQTVAALSHISKPQFDARARAIDVTILAMHNRAFLPIALCSPPKYRCAEMRNALLFYN